MADGYGSLRLKKDTLELLRDLKDAFELSYRVQLTQDEFVRKMAASVEEGDVAVWETYCLRRQMREEAERKAREKNGRR